jgi:hypothetical protein
MLSRIAPLGRLRILLLNPWDVSWSNWVLVPVAVFYILIGSLLLFNRLSGKSEALRPVQRILPVVSAYRLVNSYGLFGDDYRATGDHPRRSNDGLVWEAYEFKYKRGCLAPSTGRSAAPTKAGLADVVCGAARRSHQRGAWFIRLVERLLTNEPAVTSLLARNPFQDQPPRYIRAVLYDYEYSTPEERRKSGNWWQRQQLGLYLPPVSLPPHP